MKLKTVLPDLRARMAAWILPGDLVAGRQQSCPVLAQVQEQLSVVGVREVESVGKTESQTDGTIA